MEDYTRRLRKYKGLSIDLESKMCTKFRSIVTLNGYDFDTAKSALQKYIRRGNIKKAQYIACEMDLFRFFEGGESAWTNFYNRLRVIVFEDIGLACIGILPILDRLFDHWKQNEELSSSMLQIVKLMCLSPHTRFYSHLRVHTFHKPEIGTPIYSHHLGKDEKMRENVDGLVWCMENKNINALYWIIQILNCRKMNEKRNRSTRSGFLIFDIVRKIAGENDILRICEKWYKTMKMKEQFLCCVHPVYVYIIGDTNDVVFESEKQTIKPYNRSLTNQTLNMDDYVYDMHTKIGRTLKRDRLDFGIEGSLVVYEKDDLFGKKFYRQIAKEYINLKISQGSVSLESDEFIFKSRAQLICSAVRPDTYFAKNRIGQNVVVKGPFMNKESAMVSFKIQSILRLFHGVNIVDTSIKLLIPDLFDGIQNSKTPLGCRTKIEKDKAYYFTVMEDLMNIDKYPTVEKESKLWPKTKVVDFDTVFEDGKMGFGIPSKMSQDARLSFLLQISIRYAMKIGDFAYRNFLRIGDLVYNLDTEGVDIGNTIRFAGKEVEILKECLETRREEYNSYLENWLRNDIGWILMYNTLGINCSNEVKMLLKNPERMFDN